MTEETQAEIFQSVEFYARLLATPNIGMEVTKICNEAIVKLIERLDPDLKRLLEDASPISIIKGM